MLKKQATSPEDPEQRGRGCRGSYFGYLRFAMIDDGLSEKKARALFWVVDQDGPLDSNRRDLSDAQSTLIFVNASV
jgi:hypothetical protein